MPTASIARCPSRALAVLALVGFVLVGPAAAQVVPDEFPRPTTSIADRTERQLEEEHLPFLSRLYGQTELALGPAIGGLAPVLATTVEGGYRLRNGDAVSALFSVRSELAEDPVTGRAMFDPGVFVMAAQYNVSLRWLAPGSPAARRAEVGVGLGVGAGLESGDVVTFDLVPRYVLPIGRRTEIPLGLRLSYAVGDGATAPGTSALFVGASAGMRLGYVSSRRLVLESRQNRPRQGSPAQASPR